MTDTIDVGSLPTSSPITASVITPKVVAMLVLGTVSTAVGLLPLKLAVWLRPNKSTTKEPNERRHSSSGSAPGENSLSLALLLCAGGGVLLCTTIAQLLPEVRHELARLQTEGRLPKMDLPLAEILLACGFFAIYLLEESVHVQLNKRKKNITSNEKNGNIADEAQVAHIGNHNHSLNNGHTHGHGHSHSHAHSHLPVEPGMDTALRGLLVVLGLSVHELVEGLAVGLERSAARVWALFIAIACHKFVISFCVGMQLVGIGSKGRFVLLYVGTFSIVSALGIALGMVVTASDDGGGPVATILQGLAAGTLLHVVMLEILASQRASGVAGVRGVLAVVAGFCGMLALQAAVTRVAEG